MALKALPACVLVVITLDLTYVLLLHLHLLLKHHLVTV